MRQKVTVDLLPLLCQIILGRVAEHFKINLVNVVKFLDAVSVDLSKILDTERLLAGVCKVILLVGPRKTRDIDIKLALLSNILHILLNGLKCSDDIVSAKTINM